VRPNLPDGRRLERIYELIEAIEAWEYVKDNRLRMRNYGKRMNRGVQYWSNKKKEAERKGRAPHVQLQSLEDQVVRWLPEILSQDSLWQEPLDPEELAELFGAFGALSPRGLSDLGLAVGRGLKDSLPTANLTTTTAVLQGMIIARYPQPPAWRIIGEFALRRVAGAGPGAISGLAWALAEAKEKTAPPCFQALLDGLGVYKESVPVESLRTLAWSCAEVGLQLPTLFGEASVTVETSQVRAIREALSRLAFGPGGSQLHAEPTPVVSVEGALPPALAAGLLRLADEGGLWRPSARRGTEALPGRPWSAPLDRLEHRFSPTVNAVRLWVADSLGVPCEHVEALRLLRYREGEASESPHMDTRPPGDASLWLSGQRAAAVLVHLGDLPEGAGGEVEFPELEGLRIRPRAGVALVWPTTDYDGRPEPRMARRALPVLGHGLVRYAVATWVRSRPAPGQNGGVPS